MIDFGHLKKENKNYAEHLDFSLRLSLHLLLLSAVSVIHGLVPFVLTKTTSTGVEQLHNSVQQKAR